MKRSGRCLCGAVTFITAGEPDRVLNCHCESCRRHTGAPMATLAVFAPDQVSFEGTPRQRFQSAPGVRRSFCPKCGASLSWETELQGEDICALHISAFDNPAELRPEGHSFYVERIVWFDAHDNLPRYEGFVRGATPIQRGPSGDIT